VLLGYLFFFAVLIVCMHILYSYIAMVLCCVHSGREKQPIAIVRPPQVVFLFLVQNWMRVGGFGHYAIISQTGCKDERYHISATKNHKVSEILHYYIHTCRHKAPHSIVLLIYKMFTTHWTNLHSFDSNFLLTCSALYRTVHAQYL